MKFTKNLNKIEITGYILLVFLLSITLYFGFTDVEFFNTVFAKEDGVIENLTAVLLFSISLLQLIRFIKLRRQKTVLWLLGTLFFIFIFVFGAGEEISWGQRIFNIETTEYFKQNNLQNETNLHNLQIGDVKINKLIFGKLLTIGLAIYLIILPLLYKRIVAIERLVDNFAIPLPKIHHSIAFIITTLIIVIIPNDVSRKWEVYEFIFAGIFFLIFLSPQNIFIFQKK